MVAELVLLGLLQVTSYRPIPSQTDSSPTWTSIGDRTTKYGIAVSQDLLRSKVVKYGDILCVDRYGCRVVNDCMGDRHSWAIDMLVFTKAEEKRVGIRRLKVWKLVTHK